MNILGECFFVWSWLMRSGLIKILKEGIAMNISELKKRNDDKTITLSDVVSFVNESSGEFIINIDLSELGWEGDD